MTKKVSWLIAVLALVCLAFPLLNLLLPPANRGLIAAARAGDAAFAPIAALFGDRCACCHAHGADLPFYASFPLASGIIERDIAAGLRFFDMEAAFAGAGQPVSEVALAKLEHVLDARSMPPGRYLALHWDAGMGREDERIVRDWVRAERAKHCQGSGAAAEFAAEVVQPLQPLPELNAAKVALGDRLFHDVRLSGDDTVSCATCHDLAKGGTDQQRFSTGIRGQLGGINAPTVLNAAFAVRQFWDGRAVDLVEQAGGPVTNPIEMGAEWPAVIAKLEQDPEYVQAFAALYGGQLSAANVQDAIAEFEKSLVTTGAPFDRYLLGDAAAIGEVEKKGYALFKRHGCASCHAGRILGGQSFEHMGLREDYFAERGSVQEADHGLFNFTKKESDRGKFKVPTLRNVALTRPYFHDGTVNDLAEAVRVMARCQCDASLAAAEVESIVCFLESLTGELGGKPLK